MLPVLDHGIVRSTFLGVEFHQVDMEATLALARRAITNRQRLQHSDINVAKIVQMAADPALRSAVAESDLICVDGMGIKWASKLLGPHVLNRVTGVDLMMQTIAMCEREGYRPFLLGGSQEVLDTMVNNLRRNHPSLRLAGSRNGYFSAHDEKTIVEEICASKADCLFVGISSPIKELFLRKYRDDLNVPFLIGVGGAFDVAAGKVHRAPLYVQNIGLEWAFRVMQEPKRLFYRYLKTNLVFAFMVTRALFSRS